MIRINKRLRHTVWSVLGVCLVGYFFYHAIQGDRGWFTMLRMQHQVADAQNMLSQLQKDRQELEHRTQLMKPEKMDPDLLEEKSRELLNYSKPNEIVVMTPNDEPTKDENVLQRSK